MSMESERKTRNQELIKRESKQTEQREEREKAINREERGLRDEKERGESESQSIRRRANLGKMERSSSLSHRRQEFGREHVSSGVVGKFEVL